MQKLHDIMQKVVENFELCCLAELKIAINGTSSDFETEWSF